MGKVKVHLSLDEGLLGRVDAVLDGRPRSPWVARALEAALEAAGAGVRPAVSPRASGADRADAFRRAGGRK